MSKRGGVQVSVDLTGTTPVERRERLAGAIDTGLRTVAADPTMRLQMILGEAWSQYDTLIRWLAAELVKDEAKAPGIGELARRVANSESVEGLNALGSREMAQAKRHLLNAARMLKFENRPVLTREAIASDLAGPEHDG